MFEKIGKVALGSRMRILSDRIMDDAQRIYDLYENELKPKWFPVFYVLTNSNTCSIMAIAEEIGQTHPAIIKTVREMQKAGIVYDAKDEQDGRKTNIFLTEKGKRMAEQMKEQFLDVEQAVEVVLANTQHNIWKAMDELDYWLDQRSMYQRVRDEKKKREAQYVAIIPYEEKHALDFKRLNEEWIRKYFVMEAADYAALDHPDEYILQKGGHILVATYKDEVVGICALIKMDHPEYDYELAKMAVSPKAHGKGIGYILGKAVLEKAKALGGKKVYLESNTILVPAISLYRKLGFEKVVGNPSPYERSNIQMVVEV